jgi:hypothetical protein
MNLKQTVNWRPKCMEKENYLLHGDKKDLGRGRKVTHETSGWQSSIRWQQRSSMLILVSPEAGVLEEPDSAKPGQLSSYTGPPGYIGWT